MKPAGIKNWAGRITRRLGLPWLAVLGLAACAVWFQWARVQPAERELQNLHLQVAALQAQDKLPGSRRHKDPRLQLAGFYAGFPATESAPNYLESIHAIAKANRIELARGDYRMDQPDRAGLVQYHITLPLKGAYPDIRGFINAVLADMPSISLDNIAFERQKIGDTSVEVMVRFTLFLRSGT